MSSCVKLQTEIGLFLRLDIGFAIAHKDAAEQMQNQNFRQSEVQVESDWSVDVI